MINYESMRRKDYTVVKELIKHAWFDDYNYSKGVINLYCNYYLAHYLKKSDFLVVAKDDDKVVGFIMGSSKTNIFKKFFYDMYIAMLAFASLFTSGGRRGLKVTLKTNRANNKLKKHIDSSISGELSLFIVSSDHQRLGIGSKLQSLFYEYLKEKGKKEVYLFTDSYSNNQFYTKRGYEVVAQKTINFNVANDNPENGESIYYIMKKEL